MAIDALVVAAHPDDAELIAGGTIAKLVAAKKQVVIADVTRGEKGTRGDPETRAAEAARAAGILGVAERTCLDLGDITLQDTYENRMSLAECIRKYRPVVVMTHYWEDLHPDHVAIGRMMRDIMYATGFGKLPAAGEPYRPSEMLFFMGHLPFEPSFVVDVTAFMEQKKKAFECYKSQTYNPSSVEPPTGISQPDFWSKIESRARHYGSMIGTGYGEPFFTRRPVPVVDPVELYRPFAKL